MFYIFNFHKDTPFLRIVALGMLRILHTNMQVKNM